MLNKIANIVYTVGLGSLLLFCSAVVVYGLFFVHF